MMKFNSVKVRCWLNLQTCRTAIGFHIRTQIVVGMDALKIRIPYRILLAAALLMLGDCVWASELPPGRASISGALPRVDPQHYWFSRRGL
jgi:hypothetical protein